MSCIVDIYRYVKKVKQEGNVLQEPAAAMNLMFSLKGLYNVAMSVSRKEMDPKFHTCAPLLLCPVGSDHPGVEPLCPFTTVHCGGNDHPGVEPLCPFTTVHSRQ